jgi:hypothetical protein
MVFVVGVCFVLGSSGSFLGGSDLPFFFQELLLIFKKKKQFMIYDPLSTTVPL